MLMGLEQRIVVDLLNFQAGREMFENLLPWKQKSAKPDVPQLIAQIHYDRVVGIA